MYIFEEKKGPSYMFRWHQRHRKKNMYVSTAERQHKFVKCTTKCLKLFFFSLRLCEAETQSVRVCVKRSSVA